MNPLKVANPVNVVKGAFGLAGTAVGLAVGLARGTVHLVLSGLQHLDETRGRDAGAARPRFTVSEGLADAGEVPEPRTAVPTQSHVPAEPPVDVVGETLAAEAAAERGEGTDGQGLAHEPRGTTRDEEHGEEGLQRAEVEEIAEETAAALEGDVEPEEHLTQPLLDPADTRALAAETETMGKAADPEKG